MPPFCQRPAPVAAGDGLGPATLRTPMTMRTSALTVINLELEQPHIVHRLSAAWSADPGECDAAAPLTHKQRKRRAWMRSTTGRPCQGKSPKVRSYRLWRWLDIVPQSGQAAVADSGWVRMVTRSGVGRICTTTKPAGIKSKKRLDNDSFQRGRCSPHVLIPPCNGYPAARNVPQNLESTQYAAHEYRRVLDQHGMRCSMSRKGDCWDNAPMESFFGSLNSNSNWLFGCISLTVRVGPRRGAAVLNRSGSA